MKTPFFFLLSSCAVFAHHGQDFLLNYDPGIPEVKRAVAFSAFEWSKAGGTNEISIEPGFLYGIAPGLAVGTTVRLADEGSGSWGYSGVNPMIQYTLPAGGDRFSFGIFAGYLFADGEVHSHGHGDFVPDIDPDFDWGPDGPPTGSNPYEHAHDDGGHSHTGIHRHGEDHFQFRFLVETRLGESTRLVGNFIGIAAGAGDYAFGYSLGLRRQFSHEWAAGLETIGDFNTNGDHEVLAGAYWTPVHACTLRFGVGTGIGADAKDFSLHSGITWRF